MAWFDNINNPNAQVGLRMLAGNRWDQNIGSAFGQAALGTQEEMQKQQDDMMRRKLLQAQIDKYGAVEDSAPLEIVIGPDGKPMYSGRKDAVGKTPYLEPKGSASDTGMIQEWKASGEPDYFKFLQRRSRMVNPSTPAQEPLMIVQGPNGPMYVPRSQAVGATPGATPTAKDPNASGLNSRQQAGVNMQQESAINYAASLTKKSPEEIRQILAEKGPDGVKALIMQNGGRFLQGGIARVVGSMPFGQVAIDTANSDLLAPVKSGGAGIALSQNPQGTITSSDIQAGEAQMPNPMYPLDTQAEMIRQFLMKHGGNSVAQPAPQEQGGNVVDWADLK